MNPNLKTKILWKDGLITKHPNIKEAMIAVWDRGTELVAKVTTNEGTIKVGEVWK